MRGLEHLRAGGVECNVLTTDHAANEHRGRDVYRFLRDECGAQFMQFIPIIERVAEAAPDGSVPWSSWRDRPLYEQAGDVVTGRSVSPDGYGRFLVDVFEEWVRHDVARVYVQMFDTALANWVGEPPALCIHCETFGLALALEHTGDVYSCDHFVEPRYLLGNITDSHLIDLVASKQQRQFGLDSATPCRATVASATFASPATEASRRTVSPGPDGEPGLNYLCPSFKLFFHHVQQPMRTMADLLAADRAPAEIMDAYAAGDAQRGRNDHCTCGSGRKWKHCHGDSTPPPGRAVR